MKEQWIIEAEQKAKNLAERLYEEIAGEAGDICVDREWYFEKVIQYMRAESEDKAWNDLISRQELLNAIFQKEYGHDYDENADTLGLKYVDIIKAMLSVEIEKCEDCISRKAATDRFDIVQSDDKCMGYDDIMAFLSSLPPVEPERKPGKWIKAIDPDVNAWVGGHTCSECGRACVQMSMNYCANCGAKMEVKDE